MSASIRVKRRSWSMSRSSALPTNGDQALDAILQEPIQGRLEGAIRLFRAGDKRAVKEARGRGTPRLDSSRTTIYGKESRCNATTLMRMTVLTHW
jgi:hypothetical protein